MQLNINGQNFTLNNLINVFYQIALNHGMINSFGQGDQFEITANTVVNYPLLWVQILPGSFTQNTIKYVTRIIISDLVQNDISNELEVRSDSIDILWDVANRVWNDFDIAIDFPATVTPFTEKYSDRVTGWYMDTTLEIPRTYGSCDSPQISQATTPTENDLINFDSNNIINFDGKLIKTS